MPIIRAAHHSPPAVNDGAEKTKTCGNDPVLLDTPPEIKNSTQHLLAIFSQFDIAKTT
jgi:hypothetical protein